MNVKIILTIILLILAFNSYSQDSWETWDENYRKRDYKELIESEKQYADSIEKNTEIAQYYARLDKYKISAKFTGKSRPIDNEVLSSIKRVYKLFIGNPDQLNDLIKNEYLFEIDGLEVWMPIQSQLEKPMKKEIKKGAETILYCLLLNEHSQQGKLFNTLLISEFRKN